MSASHPILSLVSLHLIIKVKAAIEETVDRETAAENGIRSP
jgi:hypothetical protein